MVGNINFWTGFVYNFYEILLQHFSILPRRVKQFLPIFILNNWLESYLTIEGIGVVLDRMSKRTSLPDYTKFAISDFRQNYEKYRADFYEYFPLLIYYIETEHKIKIDHPDTSNDN